MSEGPKLVPCLTWVKRGVAKANPDKIQLTKEELKRLIENAQDRLEEAEEAEEDSDSQEENMDHDVEGAAVSDKMKKKQKVKADDFDDIVDKYGLDDYDDEEESAEKSRLTGMGDVVSFASNEDDPYITIKNDADSDDEEAEIRATDNLLVCGRCEGDMNFMEVFVYNEDNSQLYAHHEYLMTSFPLVVEWLNFDGYENAPGNFVAVGTMDPVIEIWDLDVMESVEPTLKLGSLPQTTKKKKKKKETVAGHTQAVLDLSWNHNARHVLASASADTTVALWDLTEGKVATTLTQHSREVQCCKWHPQEQQTLLTGSFDNTVKVFDCRSAETCHKSWKVQGEAEKVLWNHHNPLQFLTCTEQGMVYCMDIRQDKAVFTLGAHSKSVTGISLSSQVPGLLVTTSEDKSMKIWDIQADKPSLVLSRNMHMNELHCVGCCPEAPFVFAVGGKGHKVWDVRESAAVRNQFLNRMPAKLAQECAGDDRDVNDDDDADAAMAMEGLEMGEEEEEEEEKAAAAAAAPVSAKKKKKKKKKKAKKTE
ncbi:periodic tryptophan protein 1 homolog [Babylonia areolata]|uniref:periodic tryptophan protein 1 homolog n=1 Tax=Babylonia areolata TaxID=304850 RepID=UPI003FD3A854